jgi:hypothetical protein
VPTSVLLAVLAAAGLLALAPALVRKYDATERLIAERALSTARVLNRKHKPRTTPGRRPVNPPSWLALEGSLRVVPLGERAAPPKPRPRPSVYRRRQVLASLVLLNGVQTLGVALVGPGFWISFSVTAAMLILYLGHLRGQALQAARRRRAEARQAAWLIEQQAQVRRAQERRAAARREAARLLEEELQRVQAEIAELAAQAEAAEAAAAAERDKRVATISYRPNAGVRGRAYAVGPRASAG